MEAGFRPFSLSSESFMKANADKTAWEKVSQTQKMGKLFMTEYRDRLNWEKIPQYLILSTQLIHNQFHLINMKPVSKYKLLDMVDVVARKEPFICQ